MLEILQGFRSQGPGFSSFGSPEKSGLMPLHRTFQERLLMAQVMQIPHVTHESPWHIPKTSVSYGSSCCIEIAPCSLQVVINAVQLQARAGAHSWKMTLEESNYSNPQQPQKNHHETNSYCCTLPPLHQGHVACFLSSVKELLWLGASVEWPRNKPLTRKAAVKKRQRPIQRINVWQSR